LFISKFIGLHGPPLLKVYIAFHIKILDVLSIGFSSLEYHNGLGKTHHESIGRTLRSELSVEERLKMLYLEIQVTTINNMLEYNGNIGQLKLTLQMDVCMAKH